MSINIEQIDPFSLPSVELGQRDRLPRISAIYFTILNAEILYIGKSGNLHQRWKTHHRINLLQTYGEVIIAWLALSEEEESSIDDLEMACIEHFNPVINGIKTDREVKEYISLRSWSKTHHKMRLIAAYSDEKITETLDRLVNEELRRNGVTAD